MRLYCITVPCSVALDDAANQPFVAAACLLPLMLYSSAVSRAAWKQQEQHLNRAQLKMPLAANIAAFLLTLVAFFWLLPHIVALLWLRYESARDTANFPSKACQAIGLTRLDHVPPIESNISRGDEVWSAASSQETWRRGHYRYRICSSGAVPTGTSRPTWWNAT